MSTSNQAPVTPHCFLEVVIDTPLNSSFDYRWPCQPGDEPLPGQLALVSFARREVMALIVAVKSTSDVPPEKLKDALAVRSELAPLSARWLALARFAAEYYQRPLGEVALPGLPKNLRVPKTVDASAPTANTARADRLGAGMPTATVYGQSRERTVYV